MKKAFAYVLILCVGLFVFGCGGGDTKAKPKDTKDTKAAPAAPAGDAKTK